MIGWLGMALLSEGPTDDRFLPSILERSAWEVCASLDWQIDVSGVVTLRPLPGPASVEDGLDEAERNDGAFNLLVVHRDMGANAARTTREWLTPFRRAWASRARPEPLVFAAPVRETEAWGLVDGDALREVLGVAWTDEALGVPSRPALVERVPDPKRVIHDVLAKLSGPPIDVYSRLGVEVSLQVLRQVPSFQLWEQDLRVALEEML